MYEKQIAELTKTHLVSHLPAYLAEVDLLDKLNLVMPKAVDISSVVGGIMTAKFLPKYALDCMTKEFSPQGEDLYTYDYGGQITGMVGGRSAQDVDDLAKGHKAACELFVHRHEKAIFGSVPGLFTITDFGFNSSDFSGAMQIETNPKSPYWICAFQVNVNWLVSEEQPSQHG